MRSPRLETVIWLSVELIFSFVCVFFVLNLMETALDSYSIILFEKTEENDIVNFFVSIVGACSVLISSVLMSIAEYNKGEQEVLDTQKNSETE